MEYVQWIEILHQVNYYENLNPHNIIKIIKDRLAVEDKGEYEKWQKDNFGACHLFTVNNFFRKKATLLHLASDDELKNVIDNLLQIEGVTPLPMLEVFVHKTIIRTYYTTKLSTINEDIELKKCNKSHTKS